MKKVFWALLFGICVNISIGILLTSLPDLVTNPELKGNLVYKSDEPLEFSRGMNESVTPGNVLEDQSDAFDRVLDMLNVGFFSRMLNWVKTYIYGAVMLMEQIFGPSLTPAQYNLLFGPGGLPVGFFYVIMDILYALGAFWLWTGKDFRG